MKKLVLASSNPGKLREFEGLLAPLGIEIVSQASLRLAEVEEPHGTFVENALAKARHASPEWPRRDSPARRRRAGRPGASPRMRGTTRS
jgi:inosine/xanthosine triphosphate pyrophosphatase family protein